jgi:polyisoprenoid-binding protein YceI
MRKDPRSKTSNIEHRIRRRSEAMAGQALNAEMGKPSPRPSPIGWERGNPRTVGDASGVRACRTNVHKDQITRRCSLSPGVRGSVNFRLHTSLVTALITLGIHSAWAGGTNLIHYVAQPTGSKMTMDGTSTIHDWTVESPLIGGFMDVDAQFPESALSSSGPVKPDAQAFVVVRTLKSYEQHMDEVMQEHLKMAQFPRIEYRVLELQPKSPPGTTGRVEFDATGTLTVAGVTQTHVMPVTIEHLDGGRLKVSGSTPLKMTDFNVDPPAPTILGMPLIKTGDDIKISFEWVLGPKTQ